MSTDRKQNVKYLIFDIEAIADGALVSKVKYPKDALPGPAAIARYRSELIEATGKDIFPVTFLSLIHI